MPNHEQEKRFSKIFNRRGFRKRNNKEIEGIFSFDELSASIDKPAWFVAWNDWSKQSKIKRQLPES